jgi:hypothetical protein
MKLTNVLDEVCAAGWECCSNHHDLRAEISTRCRLTVILGSVSPRHDGRWNWWVKHRDYFFKPVDESGRKQGVTATELEAKACIESFWGFAPMEEQR